MNLSKGIRGAPFDIRGGIEVFEKKKTTSPVVENQRKKNSLTWGVKKKNDPEIQWRNGNFRKKKKKLHPPVRLKKKKKKEKTSPPKFYLTPTSMLPWKSNGAPLKSQWWIFVFLRIVCKLSSDKWRKKSRAYCLWEKSWLEVVTVFTWKLT